MQVASKKVYWKNNSVPNTFAILPLKKIFYQNRCIFQIPLKYIKLVIPKILFVLVLCSFNFYFKITWPPPSPRPPSGKTSKFFTPLQLGVHALKAQLKLSPWIQNRVQQDYLPESYARHLPARHPPSVDCSPFHWTFMGNLVDGEKFPLIDLNLSLSKVSFLPHQTAIFK